MRPHDTPTAAISHGLTASFAVVLCASCIPSFPPDFSSGSLDRSQPCHETNEAGDAIPWPGIGLGDDGSLGLNACGYPRGRLRTDVDGKAVDADGNVIVDDEGELIPPATRDDLIYEYGFEPNDVFENLVLFNCDGDLVQIAQFLPQFGLANGDVRGLVFSVGALWCMPCRQEAAEWGADGGFVDAYPDIAFVQGLDEGSVGNDSVTPASCAAWSTANGQDKFPILYDPNPQALQAKIEGPNSGSGLPFTMILDINANIRAKKVGGKLAPDDLCVNLDTLMLAADPDYEPPACPDLENAN